MLNTVIYAIYFHAGYIINAATAARIRHTYIFIHYWLAVTTIRHVNIIYRETHTMLQRRCRHMPFTLRYLRSRACYYAWPSLHTQANSQQRRYCVYNTVTPPLRHELRHWLSLDAYTHTHELPAATHDTDHATNMFTNRADTMNTASILMFAIGYCCHYYCAMPPRHRLIRHYCMLAGLRLRHYAAFADVSADYAD